MRFLSTICVACLMLSTPTMQADSNLDPAHAFSWSPNVGWFNWGGGDGVQVGQYFCTGYIYSGNVGWITLGVREPVNGLRFTNTGTNDFGVNCDGNGNLRGYAYGANVGWIAFEDKGAPKVDRFTGRITGYAYAGNLGWLSLSSADGSTYLRINRAAVSSDTDGDGIPDAWEYAHAGNLSRFNRTTDSDGDGISDYDEYLADTDPLDSSDFLRILEVRPSTSGSELLISWNRKPARNYTLQFRTAFGASASWQDIGMPVQLNSSGIATLSVSTDKLQSAHFFRLKVALVGAP